MDVFGKEAYRLCETCFAMDDRSTPAPAATRRGFLVTGGLVVAAAAGGGVALGLATGGSASDALDGTPPAELTAAVGAERELIASVDAALRSSSGRRRADLLLIRSDHVAHLGALRALIADTVYPATPSSAPSPAPAPAGTVGRARLRAGERRASTAAAARAERLAGRPAALLASIAAAEAAHAELLA